MTRQIPPKTTLETKAAYYFALAKSGNLKRSTAVEIEFWLAEHPSHALAFERLDKVWQASGQLSQDEAIASLRHTAIMQNRTTDTQQRNRWLAAAALVCCIPLLFVLFTVVTRSLDGVEPQQSVADTSARESSFRFENQAVATAVGERISIALSDGSVVVLNTDTEIVPMFDDMERRIVLTKGQALFDVFHEAERPFIVEAGHQEVRALGTQFEVRLQASDVSVTLLQGRVRIDERQAAQSSRTPSAAVQSARSIELSPGDRLTSSANGDITITQPDLEVALMWRDSLLSFENERLEDVINELNRYSETQLKLASDDLRDLRIGGTYLAGSTRGVLASLSAMYDIEAVPDEESNTILLRYRLEQP